jgi:tetratricopeptide (TPR) repeat protein
MLEAIKAELPDAVLVAPNRTRTNLQTIIDRGVLQHASAAGGGGVVVLWLDDLESFVRLGDSGLDGDGFAKLKQQLPSLVVAATAGGRGLVTNVEHEPHDLQEPLSRLLKHNASVREHLLVSLTTADERQALATIAPPELITDMQAALGAVAVSGEELVDILVSESHPGVDGGRTCAEGAALTWAAIAAYRLGVSEPLAEDEMRRLFACYSTTPTDAAFAAAVEWATRPLYAHVALLRRHGAALAPYDYVVQHAPRRTDDAERCTWRELLSSSSPERLLQLGWSAVVRGATDDAIDAFQHADERGLPTASTAFGLMLEVRGDVENAEAAYIRADRHGHSHGAYNLGRLLKQRGDLEGAEAAWQRADKRGDGAAPSSLGVLLKERGDLEGTEAAWQRADRRGHGEGAYYLGQLLFERGDLEGAEAAYKRAEQRGHLGGAHNLGRMLVERGDPEGAEAAWRRADERDDPAAAYSLGGLLFEHGDLEGAEAAWRRADERGLAEGAYNLGVVLKQRGDLDGAEAAWRRADERGNPTGAFNLGLLLAAYGDLEGAEAAWRRADERGNPSAPYSLGVLLKQRGDLEGAEASYRRADARGHPGGAYNLGVLLKDRGDNEGAKVAWRRAVDSSDDEVVARAQEALAEIVDE